MNTKNRAASLYPSFPFNSFAKIGDDYYGASSEGLFKLSGDTDDGEDIEAEIAFGSHEFNPNGKSSVYDAYIALRNDGEIALKIKTDDDTERWYSISRTSDVLRDHRMKTRKGVKSRFWSFSLANIDGADFEVDAIELVPIILKRRV